MSRPRIRTVVRTLALTLFLPIFGNLSCKTSNQTASSFSSTTRKSQLFDNKSWPEYQAERQSQVDAYLSSRKVAFDWYVNSPLGVNGVPVALLTFLMNRYPDIWEGRVALPPHFSDYDENNDIKPKDQRRVLPLGMGWAKDFDEKDPKRQTNNVFFSCGACHISRVIVEGKVKHFIGAPSNEVEPQAFAGAIWETGRRLVGDLQLKQEDLNFPERLDKIGDTVAVGKLYAEMRIHRDVMVTKKFFSKLPFSMSRGQAGSLPSHLDNDDMIREYNLLVNNFSFFREVVTNFIGSYVKANTLYKEIGAHIPFRPRDPNDADPEGRKQPPALFGPRPGQMDAFGLVQGIIILNAIRPDYSWLKYSEDRYGADSPFWLGAQGSGEALYKDFQDRLGGKFMGLRNRENLTEQQKKADRALVAKWYSPNSALTDIKPVWLSSKETNANWDGNQAANSRALASGVSSVGDPRKVDTNLHSVMNPFIDDLPAPAWPFDVDVDRAERGEKLFKGIKGGESCVSCHFDNNIKVYNVGTDMNRAYVSGPEARLYLKSLAMEACSLGMKRPGETTDRVVDGVTIKKDWCATKSSRDEEDIYRRIDTTNRNRRDSNEKTGEEFEQPIGYKADPLNSIWASAPFLHNGSVPTLWALFKPSARPKAFYRGNINYNQEEVGYEYTKSDDVYPANAGKNIVYYDTTLRGNSNGGHDSYTKGWSDEEIRDLIEYLKVH